MQLVCLDYGMLYADIGMEETRIDRPVLSADGLTVSATIRMGAREHSLYFRTRQPVLAPNTEAFLAAALLPSMKCGYPIAVNAGISKRMLEGISTIQDIHHCWRPSMAKVEIRGASPVEKPAATMPKVGSFFSCGIDSSYTLLKNRDVISDLVMIHGFSVDIDNSARWRMLSEAAERVAGAFGKRVIYVETNLKAYLKEYISWRDLGFGAMLATVAHLLSPHLSTIYFPASDSNDMLEHFSSHPLTDPLWGTESLEIIHDGCEASRLSKTKAIARNDVLRDNIHVCLRTKDTRFNCGRCQKCIRTMLSLEMAGAFGSCKAFDTPLTPRLVAALIIADNETARHYLREIMLAMKADGSRRFTGLRLAIGWVLNRPVWLSRLILATNQIGRKMIGR
ncbi:MAG: hypothetical protein WCL44_03190 [bacterium]